MPIGCANHVPEYPSTISPVHARRGRGRTKFLLFPRRFRGGLELEWGLGERGSRAFEQVATIFLSIFPQPQPVHIPG
jgi:hypothetical protein